MANTHSLAAIIQMYRRLNLPKLQAHLRTYSELTLQEAIHHAAMAERYNTQKGHWNRHDHQRRIKRASLLAAHEKLLEVRFPECTSFHDLFVVVEKSIGVIPGIGELTVYDTSLRIGANLGLQPDRVYLHSGTRKGAERLGLRSDSGWLLLAQLPVGLQSLLPSQIEDLLCIYKDHLASDE